MSEEARTLDNELSVTLAGLFADKVIADAGLPGARRQDLKQSVDLRSESGDLICTCEITGSTHRATWDGTFGRAVALIDEAAAETAFLVGKTPHYAWLRLRK